MAKQAFRIRPYKHPRLKWLIRSKLSGKWERKFFETKCEAEGYKHLKEIELLNQGKEGATFPSSLRVMAQRESERLKAYGKTLTDATDFYIGHLKARAGSVLVGKAIEELIKNRRSSGASKRYCNDLRLRLGRLDKPFENRTIAELTTHELDEWLENLNVAPTTRNTFRRDARTLFSFAFTRGYCSDNAATRTRKAKEIPQEIRILTVAECQQLLGAADSDMLPFFAIGAFAGLRRSEIEQLTWEQVDFQSRLIEVKARQAKTARRRLVNIEANLCDWLQPYAAESGAICPTNFRKRFDDVRKKAGLLEVWQDNILRHSYGSYYLGVNKDVAALALQMGNSPAVIFKHYRNLVKPDDATRYWKIRPVLTDSDKIVRFK